LDVLPLTWSLWFGCSEMMSPALIEYIFRYVATGSLEVKRSRFPPC